MIVPEILTGGYYTGDTGGTFKSRSILSNADYRFLDDPALACVGMQSLRRCNLDGLSHFEAFARGSCSLGQLTALSA